MFLSFALLAGSAVAQTINTFSNFSSISGPGGVTLNGNAAVVGSGASAVLRLTPAAANQAGSAFSNSSLTLWGFSTSFQFRLTSNPAGKTYLDSSGAAKAGDGFAFVLRADTESGVPLGASGGQLGYGNGTMGLNSIAFVFDTWKNADLGDPSNNFIGIVSGGVLHKGSLPTASIAGDFTDGSLWTAWIDFVDGGTNVEMRVGQGARPISPDLTYAQGVLSNSWGVYAGFTGGTGGNYAAQDIEKWTFGDVGVNGGVTAGLAAIPEPANFGILGGLAALGCVALRRRQAKSAA